MVMTSCGPFCLPISSHNGKFLEECQGKDKEEEEQRRVWVSGCVTLSPTPSLSHLINYRYGRRRASEKVGKCEWKCLFDWWLVIWVDGHCPETRVVKVEWRPSNRRHLSFAIDIYFCPAVFLYIFKSRQTDTFIVTIFYLVRIFWCSDCTLKSVIVVIILIGPSALLTYYYNQNKIDHFFYKENCICSGRLHKLFLTFWIFTIIINVYTKYKVYHQEHFNLFLCCVNF